jgi:outer membrane lipoprotein-sorting protein
MRRALFILALFCFLVAPAWSEELTAKQIVDKMAKGFDQKDMMVQIKMSLVDGKGTKRERLMRSRMKEVDGLSKSVISFEEPADVRGTKFLVLENKGRDDDQSIYLPALKRVRRISSSQRSESFMGTDFSYYDLSTHNSEEGDHKKLPDETMSGTSCYVIETVPKASSNSEYSKVKYWVRKDNMIAIKGEFYDKSGKLMKTMTSANLEQYKPGKWLARNLTMTNSSKGTSTVIDITKYALDAALADDFFTERFLKDESQF